MLSVLAKKYKDVIINSADGERSNSIYKLVLSRKRRSITNNNLKALIFLYHNQRLTSGAFERDEMEKACEEDMGGRHGGGHGGHSGRAFTSWCCPAKEDLSLTTSSNPWSSCTTTNDLPVGLLKAMTSRKLARKTWRKTWRTLRQLSGLFFFLQLLTDPHHF